MYIGATWPIRMNRPCAAVMWPYVKLLWPFVTVSSQKSGNQMLISVAAKRKHQNCDYVAKKEKKIYGPDHRNEIQTSCSFKIAPRSCDLLTSTFDCLTYYGRWQRKTNRPIFCKCVFLVSVFLSKHFHDVRRPTFSWSLSMGVVLSDVNILSKST